MNINTKVNQQGLSIFSDTSRFPFIPDKLPLYVKTCITKNKNNRLVEAVQGQRTNIFKNINDIFEIASRATGLTSDELLRQTDFNYHDLDPNRLDSAFAEIRTIIFLNRKGFKDIELLKAGKEKKADILATRQGIKYAIEVANSIFSANNRVEPSDLKNWLVGRATSEGKTSQLEQTSVETNINYTILVGVIDSFSTIAYNTHEDFCDAAMLVWKELNRKKGFHVAFVTGREATGYGMDDCVIPNLPL